MATLKEERARLQFLEEHGHGDEMVHVVFPKREAAERIKNPNGKKRVVIVTDEHGYSQFHARREAWMQALDNNPTLFMLAMDTAMKDFDLLGWKEQQA
jgi:hypothetical protein